MMDELHTPQNPYCDDISCWCHCSADYHAEVVDPTATTDENMIALAYAFLELERMMEEVQA